MSEVFRRRPNSLHFFKRCTVSICLAWIAAGSAIGQEIAKQEFVGSTPCDLASRKFLGGIAPEAPCHCIAWRLILLRTGDVQESGTYTLEVTYGIPGSNDPNQLVEGPMAKLQGKWDIVRGSKANSQAVVYRIHRNESDQTLLLSKVSERLIHFLNQDKTMRVGNAGWSYTLNRIGTNRRN